MKYTCLKCGKKAEKLMWNPFITYKSNVDCFCLDCYEKELKKGNWMSECGYCKHFKTEVCFDCVKSSKLELGKVKQTELKDRFGKFLKKMQAELTGITVTMEDGVFMIPIRDIRRAADIAIKNYSSIPFD